MYGYDANINRAYQFTVINDTNQDQVVGFLGLGCGNVFQQRAPGICVKPQIISPGASLNHRFSFTQYEALVIQEGTQYCFVPLTDAKSNYLEAGFGSPGSLTVTQAKEFINIMTNYGKTLCLPLDATSVNKFWEYLGEFWEWIKTNVPFVLDIIKSVKGLGGGPSVPIRPTPITLPPLYTGPTGPTGPNGPTGPTGPGGTGNPLPPFQPDPQTSPGAGSNYSYGQSPGVMFNDYRYHNPNKKPYNNKQCKKCGKLI